VQLTGLTKAYGPVTLFEGLGLRVDPGERLAVVGRNGAGKTTLLRIVAGQLAPDAGEVSLPRGATVALHDQRPPLERDMTLGAYVAEGLSGAREAEARLQRLEERMAAGDAAPATLAEYERAAAALERAGGYAWRSWLERVLRGLGLPESELERPLAGFSGGELTRASLARALVARPDVLLLDEPTNHLDLEALEWLERTLGELDASVLMVSHDRWFLESTATGVLELEAGRAKLWPLRYSAFRRAKAEALGRQAALAERQAAEIARLERFVARWSAGTRARQATSRKRQLARIQRDAPALAGLRLPARRAQRPPGRGGRRAGRGRRRPDARRGRLLRRRAGVARRRGRPEWRRQDHAGRDADRRPPAGAGADEPRPPRPRRLLLPARARAAGRAHGAGDRPRRQRPDPGAGADAARELPLLRRYGGPAGRAALRR
jgi:ATPase subunit of ABC transporter with duplicated ATPase domains